MKLLVISTVLATMAGGFVTIQSTLDSASTPVRLAAEASSSEGGTPIQGAPIDAPVEAPGAPDAGGAAARAKPLGRALPQASLDLLEQAETGTVPAAKGFERTKDGKYFKVTFSALGGFDYEVPDPDAVLASPDPTKPLRDQIPGEIKKLNGQKVVVVGFMVPIEVDNKGNVKSYALTQNQMFCCFGVAPAMNEWVMVTVDGEPARYYSDLPIATFGEMQVGEEIEDGYVMSVYRMKAEKVMDVRELLTQAKASP
jgi:hypothetical protein